MTDTIDEQRNAMRPMSNEEIADMQNKADARNAPWSDRHDISQAYMNNWYRATLDMIGKPYVKPSLWQRFVRWINRYI